MMPLGQAMDETNRAMDESVQRADFREGVRSFLEQRPPMFPRLGG
jgi:enoyl-CoA hydratase/carnithine racemase